MVSLFHEHDWSKENSLQYSLFNETIINLESQYFPFVKIIHVRVDTENIKKEALLCDSIHQKYEGNMIQAKIIYENLIKESKFFK